MGTHRPSSLRFWILPSQPLFLGAFFGQDGLLWLGQWLTPSDVQSQHDLWHLVTVTSRLFCQSCSFPLLEMKTHHAKCFWDRWCDSFKARKLPQLKTVRNAQLLVIEQEAAGFLSHFLTCQFTWLCWAACASEGWDGNVLKVLLQIILKSELPYHWKCTWSTSRSNRPAVSCFKIWLSLNAVLVPSMSFIFAIYANHRQVDLDFDLLIWQNMLTWPGCTQAEPAAAVLT